VETSENIFAKASNHDATDLKGSFSNPISYARARILPFARWYRV